MNNKKVRLADIMGDMPELSREDEISLIYDEIHELVARVEALEDEDEPKLSPTVRSDNGYLLVVSPEAIPADLLRALTLPEDGREPQGLVLEVPGVDPRITVETDGASVALKADFDPEHKAWHACLKDPTSEWEIANADPAWERNVDFWAEIDA